MENQKSEIYKLILRTASNHNVSVEQIVTGLAQVTPCSWTDADVVEALGYLGDFGINQTLAYDVVSSLSDRMTLSDVVELGRYDSGDEYKNVMNAVNKAGLKSARSVFAISEGKRYAELKDRE